jgi:hypothetical protein
MAGFRPRQSCGALATARSEGDAMSAEDPKYTRRVFVRGGGVALGLAVIAPAAFAVGCGGEEAVNCTSPPGLTPDERMKRGQLNYAESSADPARKCADCTFFTASAQNAAACGPCTLGLGAVNPLGTCDSFAPRS